VAPPDRQAPQTTVDAPTIGSTVPTNSLWSLRFTLSTGRYQVVATARDAAGNEDLTPAFAKFDVRAGRGQTNQALPAGSILLKGNATDDQGVVAVLVSVRDTVTQRWIQADGSFGAQQVRFPATLASGRASGIRWNYPLSIAR
jgi:hypothetical protein